MFPVSEDDSRLPRYYNFASSVTSRRNTSLQAAKLQITRLLCPANRFASLAPLRKVICASG